jgi:hypothetical protein
MRRFAEWTAFPYASALVICSLSVAPAAFGQGSGSYTQCHTYVGGDTVYTSRPVPTSGDTRAWLAPFQAFITQKYGQASGGRCLNAESVDAAKARLPQGPKIIETDWTYSAPKWQAPQPADSAPRALSRSKHLTNNGS